MFTGTLPAISRQATYTESLEVKDEDEALFDLTGAMVTVGVYELDDLDTAQISGSTTDGKVTLPSLGIIEFRFDPMTALDQGHYRLRVVAERSGDTVLLVDALLPVVD